MYMHRKGHVGYCNTDVKIYLCYIKLLCYTIIHMESWQILALALKVHNLMQVEIHHLHCLPHA